jgi:hypothetical protein
MREKTSEVLERTCHWRKTMQRLVVSHVKSIYLNSLSSLNWSGITGAKKFKK